MRLVVFCALAACLGRSSPPVDHRVELVISGLSSTGPAAYRATADLDRRVLEISIPGDEIATKAMHTRGPDKVSSKPLPQGTVDELRRLASAARYEEPGDDPDVSDHLEVLRFDGEPAKEISQSLISGPVAKQLAQRLGQLAGF